MTMRLLELALCGCLVAWTRGGAAPAAKDIEAIFQPFRVAEAALARDGRHVAFAVRERGAIEVQVYEIGNAQVKTRVPVERRRGTADVRFLGWSATGRLVVATDAPRVLAVDADGRNSRVLVDAKTFTARDDGVGRSVRVLGLAADDPAGLMLEARSLVPPGEVGLALMRVDVLTGEWREAHRTEVERPGGALIVDRQGRARLLFAEGSLPQRFHYRAVSGGSWRPLDRLAGKATEAFVVTPQNFLGERSIPLGFDHDPEVMYFASNAGRDTFGVYAWDFRAQGRTELAIEDAEFDLSGLTAPWLESPLVFDRARRSLAGVRRVALETGTRWVDQEIAQVQATLERRFPGRSVQVLEWDDARERFLVLVASNGDPGRYFVHHRVDGRCVEYLRRGSAVPAENLNRTEAFAIEVPGGGRTSGYLTLPHAPAVAKPPLLVWLHDGPWQRTAPGFNRDAQALATMGFVVAQVDYRGSAGFGRARREAIRSALDAGPLEDVQAVVRWLEERVAFDRRRVAVAGEGYGGYLALRALQRTPEAFRCAVSINAPVELGDLRRSLAREETMNRETEREMLERLFSPPATPEEREVAQDRRLMRAMNAPTAPVDFEHELQRWFFGDAKRLGEISVLRQAERITKPVMLLHDPRHRHAPVASVQELRAALERRKQPVAFGEISSQFARGVPAVRAQVIRRVGEFLNVTLYDFDVKVGEAKEKEEGK